jgi:hypothetical protein
MLEFPESLSAVAMSGGNQTSSRSISIKQSYLGQARQVGYRAIIDATRPWEWKDAFPKVNVPSRGLLAKTKEK